MKNKKTGLFWRNTRASLLGMLLLLLGFAGTGKAAPAPDKIWLPYIVTVNVIQNNVEANNNDNDILEVVVIDQATGLPVDGIKVNINISGTTVNSGPITGSNGWPTGTIQFGLSSPSTAPATINIQVIGSTGPIPSVVFIYHPASGSPNPPGNPSNGTNVTNFFIVTDNQPAGGSDVVEAHITDVNGNNVANADVTLTITGNGTAAATAEFAGNVKTILVHTDANGNVLVPITSSKVGTVEVSASIIDPATSLLTQINGSTKTVTFVTGPASPTAPNAPPGGGTNFFITTDNQPAGGSDVVQAHITDAYGNPVANVDVTITITGNGSAAGPATFPGGVKTIVVHTDANGDASIPVTDTKAGKVELSASIIDPATNVVTFINGSTQTVTFVSNVANPNPPGNPAGGTNFTITTDNQQAGGTDMVLAHISDAYGNPVAGVDVTITITGNGTAAGTAYLPGGLKTITVKTDANGDVPMSITDSKVGTVEVSASIIDPATNTATFINGSTQTVTFVTNSPSTNPPGNPAGGTNFYITTDGQPAGGTDMVMAHISDAYGNPIAGVDVTITITGNGTAAGTAMLAGGVKTITVKTDANGNVPMSITDTKVGTVELSASIIDPATNTAAFINGSTQTVTFITGPASPTAPNAPTGTGTNFSISVDKQPVDGSPDQVTAHITDAYGNPVANVDVTITITGNGTASGPAQLPGSVKTITVKTDANGNVTVPITDTKAGTVELSASIIDPATNAATFINGSTQTVTFVAGTPVNSAPGAPSAPGGGPGGTLLTISYNNVPADGVKADTADAYITDMYGNPVAGVPVTFTLHTGGSANSGALFQPGNTITITVNTDASGHAYAPITDTVPGDAFIDASITNGGLIDGSYATAHFTEAPDVNNPETQLVVIIYEALADGTSTTVVKAHVVDKSGNPMNDQEVVFAIDSGKAQISTPGPWTTDANGDVFISLTSKTTGYDLVTATINGKSIIFGSPARVKFAPINIYVPKVFTPNNDGTNDVLKPILVGIAQFHYFSVYNRWGNLIYTTQDPNRGWDGKFKGVAQPVETYLWIAEGVDVTGKTIVQKGMTSLVR